MKRASLVIFLLAFVACGETENPKPVSEAGEKLYDVRGVIISRNRSDNSLKVDHEPIPGFMAAMVMDYQVRGAEVASLPADRSRIEAKLHVTRRSYWISDVKSLP